MSSGKHRKPKAEPVQPAESLKQSKRGTVILRREFPGAIIKPDEPLPIQVIEDVVCRYCRGPKVRCIKTYANRADYRCFSCVDPETGTWTTFTVGRKRAR